MRALVLTSVLGLFLILPACGGGGGGGGDVGAGNASNVSLDASPRRIDSGDRIEMMVRLRDIQIEDFENISVKILHPAGLRYVDDSGMLTTHALSNGSFAPQTFEVDESSYTLFTIDIDDINESHRWADIEFLFRGRGTFENGTISIDVDNSNVNPARFDSTNPLFTSLDNIRVTVE